MRTHFRRPCTTRVPTASLLSHHLHRCLFRSRLSAFRYNVRTAVGPQQTGRGGTSNSNATSVGDGGSAAGDASACRHITVPSVQMHGRHWDRRADSSRWGVAINGGRDDAQHAQSPQVTCFPLFGPGPGTSNGQGQGATHWDSEAWVCLPAPNLWDNMQRMIEADRDEKSGRACTASPPPAFALQRVRACGPWRRNARMPRDIFRMSLWR